MPRLAAFSESVWRSVILVFFAVPDGRFSCRGGSAYSLIADTSGTPRRPLGTTFARHLERLAFGAPTAWLAVPG